MKYSETALKMCEQRIEILEQRVETAETGKGFCLGNKEEQIRAWRHVIAKERLFLTKLKSQQPVTSRKRSSVSLESCGTGNLKTNA